MYLTDEDIDRLKTPKGGYTGRTIKIMQDFTGCQQWKQALKNLDILPAAWEAIVSDCVSGVYKEYGFMRSGDLLIPNEDIADVYVKMTPYEYKELGKAIKIYLDFLRRVQDGRMSANK